MPPIAPIAPIALFDIRRRTISLAIAALAISALAASGWTSALAGIPASGAPTVRIDKAWIRWLPAGLPQGGYLTMTNTGEKAIALTSVTSPSYGEVMLHRNVHEGSTVKMVPVAKIVLEPHQTVDFESSGYHLMLMQPAPSLGDTVSMTLHFADGSSLAVPFQVRKLSSGT